VDHHSVEENPIRRPGFGESCSTVRRRRWSLVLPGGLPITERVAGDALIVLRVVVADWPT
jgi:hypothetical protein